MTSAQARAFASVPLELELQADKPVYKATDPIGFTLKFHNKSTAPVTMRTGLRSSTSRFIPNTIGFKLTQGDATTNSYFYLSRPLDELTTHVEDNGVRVFQNFAPGETASYRLFLEEASIRSFDIPAYEGEYRLYVGFGAAASHMGVTEAGENAANPPKLVTFSVLPLNPNTIRIYSNRPRWPEWQEVILDSDGRFSYNSWSDAGGQRGPIKGTYRETSSSLVLEALINADDVSFRNRTTWTKTHVMGRPSLLRGSSSGNTGIRGLPLRDVTKPLTREFFHTAYDAKQTSDLATGGAPAPLSFDHFPSRLHALVWRNWGLVPAATLAATIGATPQQVIDIGQSMGLAGPPEISADQVKRSAITIIRRNWHLLPYEQLLTLLDWTADEMDFALREDDFLFIKLGSLKPKCEPIWYEEPTTATQARSKEIADTIRSTFPEGVGAPKEPLFQFVHDLSEPLSGSVITSVTDGLSSAPRICYSYFALYGDPLLETEADPYPDGLLERLAAVGINGIWMQGMLNRLAPFPWDEKVSRDWAKRLANLQTLTERAARHGIKVYLYINEPRAMPEAFFERHPHLKGVTEHGYATLCTSIPEVREWLTSATQEICSAAPELGGFFTISMSENLTNCWSHWKGADCPRCARVGPANTIAALHHSLADGIKNTTSSARLIAWDWQWQDDWITSITESLPAGTTVMSTSEWDLPITRGGVSSRVGEYSISAVGPGKRAKRNWLSAQTSGLQAMAKMQVGNTWELSVVPNIPAVDTVARHSADLRDAGVTGALLGWTLGGYPSPNLEVAALIVGTSITAEAALEQVARGRYSDAAPAVRAAWTGFSKAFSELPYYQTVVYNAPLQMGPANLLWKKPTGYRATMVGLPYDDLERWRAVYPPEVFMAQLTKVADGFDTACLGLRQYLASSPAIDNAHRTAVEAELRIGEAAAIHFRSVANQSEFVHLRDQQTSVTDHGPRMTQLLRSEMELARRLKSLQDVDSRIGFEASNQYYYTGMDLAEKVLNCQFLLTKASEAAAAGDP